MPAKPQILFVSHDASATGAPNSLLNFLDWNVQHRKCDFRILLLDGGPLEEQFAQRGPTTVIRRPEAGLGHLLSRSWHKLQAATGRGQASQPRWSPSRSEQRRVDTCLAEFKPDVIYVNSVAAAPVLACLEELDVPVLTFLRELDEYVEKTRATGWLEPLIDRTHAFISVSDAARQHFLRHYGSTPDRWTVINTFVDTRELRHASKPDCRAALLERAGIKDAGFIVAGCGTTDWRKGPDLFLTIARIYFEDTRRDRTVFIWIGGVSSPAERLRISHDIRMAGMEDRVIFIGQQPDAAVLVAGADVLALTSREEPFARVMLEAALGKCPVVGFERSGGTEEFTQKGAGVAVPYLSVNAFAAALQQLRQDEELRATLGEAALQIVLRDHDVQLGSQRIFSVVESLLEPAQRNHRSAATERARPSGNGTSAGPNSHRAPRDPHA